MHEDVNYGREHDELEGYGETEGCPRVHREQRSPRQGVLRHGKWHECDVDAVVRSIF